MSAPWGNGQGTAAPGQGDQLTPYQRFMGWGGPGQPQTWEQGMFGPTGSPTGEGATPAQLARTMPAYLQGMAPIGQQAGTPTAPLQAQPNAMGANQNLGNQLMGQPPGMQGIQGQGLHPLMLQFLQWLQGQGGGTPNLQQLMGSSGGSAGSGIPAGYVPGSAQAI